MAHAKPFVERCITGVLVLGVSALAVVALKREFFPPARPDRVAPAPEYVSDWVSLLELGSRTGSDTAPIQIVEFADLQCPACRSEQAVLQRIREERPGITATTFVHSPLAYHVHAIPAAVALECAGLFERREAFIDNVYQKQDSLGAKSWLSYARDVGINDSTTFTVCLADADSAHARTIESGKAAGKRIGLQGTPTMIVNGWRYHGALGHSLLSELIDDLLAGKDPRGAQRLDDSSATSRRQVVVPRRNVRSGVESIEFGVDAFEQVAQFEISKQPEAVIGAGAFDPAFDLTNVRNALLLADGRVVASSSVGGIRLLLFSKTGAPDRVLGRAGAGPGDFQRFSAPVRIRGDTLVVFDPGNSRVSWLTSKGVARSRAIRSVMTDRTEQLAGVLDDDRIIVHAGGGYPTRTPVGRERSFVPLVVLHPDRLPLTLATLPDFMMAPVETNWEGRLGAMGFPEFLGPQAQVVVWDTLIATGLGEEYRIDLRDSKGMVVAKITVPNKPRLVTSAMREADIERRLARLPAGPVSGQRAETERIHRSVPFADTLAAFSGLFVSPQGSLWVLDAIAPTDSVWSATAFDRQFRMIARVRGNTLGTPVAFSDNQVVIRRVDDDDLVQLHVHGFRALRD